MKKIVIVCLVLIGIVLLWTLGFVPVKYAVYESGKKTNPNKMITFWYLSGKQSYDSNILEYVNELNRPHWKLSGSDVVGEDAEYNNTPVYFREYWNSPLWWLNSNFNPQKVKNYYAVKYDPINESERKENHFEQAIVIVDWAPIYPIQRSGWLANKLLPKDRLVIWDFIGWRACW